MCEEASKAYLLEKSIHSNIDHLITHRHLDKENPGFSKIYLSDTVLVNYEIPLLDIKTK